MNRALLSTDFISIRNEQEQNFPGIYLIEISNLVRTGIMKFHQMLKRKFPLTVIRCNYIRSKESSMIFVEGKKGIKGALYYVNHLIWKLKPLRAHVSVVARPKCINRRMTNGQISKQKFEAFKRKNAAIYPSLRSYKTENNIIDKYIEMHRLLSSLQNDMQQTTSINKIQPIAIKPQCKLLGIRPSPKCKQYRNKCEFDVEQGENGKFTLNIVNENESENIPTDGTIPKIIEDIRRSFAKYLSDYHINTFNLEIVDDKFIRFVVRISGATDDIMIKIIVDPIIFKDDEELHFTNDLIIFFKNLKSTNYLYAFISVFYKHFESATYEHLLGSKHIIDVLCTIPFEIGPLSTFPINTSANDLLYREAIKLLTKISPRIVVHISDGNANLSLCLASRCTYVVGFDTNIESIKDAKKNLKDRNIVNMKIVHGDPISFIKNMDRRRNALLSYSNETAYITVVIDQTFIPMDFLTLQTINESVSINRIIYISRDYFFGDRDLKHFCRTAANEHLCNPFTPKVALAVDVLPDVSEAVAIILLER